MLFTTTLSGAFTGNEYTSVQWFFGDKLILRKFTTPPVDPPPYNPPPENPPTDPPTEEPPADPPVAPPVVPTVAAEEQVLGARRENEQAVLGARRAATEDTSNSAERMVIMVLAACAAVGLCSSSRKKI